MKNTDDVQMVAIDQIRIINPRHRDRKKFELIVQSIKNVGLKKPIQVSLRHPTEGDELFGYDLVCGQGRIEAFTALGHKEIPAIVVEVSKEERLVRSLVENIARRHCAPIELIHEIERLKGLGYSNIQIGKKLDVSDSYVGGLVALKTAGEERLLEAALSGKVTILVAMEIAKIKDIATQREFLKAYESKQLHSGSIRTVKRLLDQRRLLGKKRSLGEGTRRAGKTSAESLVTAYKRESHRQKMLVKKAKVCDAKMLFIVTAFTKLVADENFMTLLRAEALTNMPKFLWDKVNKNGKTI